VSWRLVQEISEFEDVQFERIWDWHDPHIVSRSSRDDLLPTRPTPSASTDDCS
jgi:hypothetical protein